MAQKESWYIYWGYWTASPGTNDVTVTVDPDHSVAETTYADNTTTFTFTPQLALTPSGYTVDQIRTTYGINSIPNFGTAAADGSGQTIAIVDAYNDPNIFTDLDGFDKAMTLTTGASQTLYQQYGASSSILTVFNQSGTNISAKISQSGVGGVPGVDPTGGWEGEITMDVEWAHAIAPGAKIDLIECSGSGSFDGLFTGASTAAKLPGVTVVSMSWIWSEANWSSSGGAGELAYDASTFVTPSGHPGVTFLAASGDGGMPGGYPAFSPNVVAVGGTTLNLSADTRVSETGWSFPTPRALDNGTTNYTQTGPWTSNSGGFGGTYNTAAGGTAAKATWTTSISAADKGWVSGVEVSATWVAKAGNATNASYSIYNGTATAANLLGTVHVNQTKAPVGTLKGTTAFQELGDYYPTSGKITVVLNAGSANGTVVADGIGIAPAWASGGGQSLYEAEPAYQSAYQSTGKRTTPDVSFDANINTGVWCYDSYNYPSNPMGEPYGGTSLAAAVLGRADRHRQPGTRGRRRRFFQQPQRSNADAPGFVQLARQCFPRHHQRLQRQLSRAGLRQSHRPRNADRQYAHPGSGQLRARSNGYRRQRRPWPAGGRPRHVHHQRHVRRRLCRELRRGCQSQCDGLSAEQQCIHRGERWRLHSNCHRRRLVCRVEINGNALRRFQLERYSVMHIPSHMKTNESKHWLCGALVVIFGSLTVACADENLLRNADFSKLKSDGKMTPLNWYVEGNCGLAATKADGLQVKINIISASARPHRTARPHRD